MTEKHVLTRRKHDMLGNQNFEVLWLLTNFLTKVGKLAHLLMCFWYTNTAGTSNQVFLCSRISEMRWFRWWLGTYKWNMWTVSYKPFVLMAVELQMFAYQACHICTMSTLRWKQWYTQNRCWYSQRSEDLSTILSFNEKLSYWKNWSCKLNLVNQNFSTVPLKREPKNCYSASGPKKIQAWRSCVCAVESAPGHTWEKP